MDKTILEDKIIYTLYEENILPYQLNMINNNDINILKIDTIEEIGKTKFIINTKNYISIMDYVKKYEPLIKDELKSRIDNIINDIRDYLLDEDNLIIDENSIFIDLEKYLKDNVLIYKFVYLPVNNMENSFSDSYDRLFNLGYIFKSNDVIKMMDTKVEEREDLLKLLLENDVENDKQEKSKISKKMIYSCFIASAIILLYLVKKSMLMTIIVFFSYIFIFTLYKLIEKYNKESEFIDEEINDKTFVIDNYPYFKKGLLDDKVYITCNDFTIGKDDKNKFKIANPSVSKKHAKLIKKKLGYYIVDLSSTNHTYVNDEQIESNIERLLVNGDKVKFGNEQYQFYYDK